MIIADYISIVPYFLLALFIALLATPLVGKLAMRIGALDLPARLRKPGDDANTRINSKVTARLGGLSIVIAIGLVLLLSERLGFSSLSSTAGFNSFGIWIGVLILTVAGIYDDIKGMKAWVQILVQFAAALMVVIAGVELDSLSVGNEILNIFGSFDFNLLGVVFELPADLIILFWIVAVMNFVNWASGVDALHGGLSAVTLGTLLLIAMQSGNPLLATLIAIHLGSVLGVLPFNYYPSKIFYGFGESINGFLIAVFAISGDIKFATSLIILGLPLVDAAWVMFNRIRIVHQSGERNIIKLMQSTMKGDRTHLHHRLLELGLGWRTVFFIELAIMLAFSLVAFQSAGFNPGQRTVQLVIALLVLMIIFIVLNVLLMRRKQQRLNDKLAGVKQADVAVKIKVAEPKESDEEKFIY